MRQKAGEPGSAPRAGAKKGGYSRNCAKELRDCAGQLHEWRAEGLAVAKSVKTDHVGQNDTVKRMHQAYKQAKDVMPGPVSV